MNKNNKNWNECVELLNEICSGKGSWANALRMSSTIEEVISTVTEKAKKAAEKYGFTTIEKYDIFMDFYNTLYSRLYDKLEKYWLNGTLDTRIAGLSDDGFHYFLNNILGYGYFAYCEVMKDWKNAFNYRNYSEGFDYCFEFMYEHNIIEDREV